MTLTTFAKWPRWTIVGLVPHGTVALYIPATLSRDAVLDQLVSSVRNAKTFLGYRALKGSVFDISEDTAPKSLAELHELLTLKRPSLLVLRDISLFKAPNKFEDYAALTRLAHSFKVTILLAAEKRSDAVDFALDTLIVINIPATADDDPIYVFKVEARDIPPIRGKATFNPASGLLEVAK